MQTDKLGTVALSLLHIFVLEEGVGAEGVRCRAIWCVR